MQPLIELSAVTYRVRSPTLALLRPVTPAANYSLTRGRAMRRAMWGYGGYLGAKGDTRTALRCSGEAGVSRGIGEVLERYSERVEEDVLEKFLRERR